MGRRVGLSVDDVVRAAAEIADVDGLDGVTLASVAERLGIRSPSLYAHVKGLDGLRRQLALTAAKEMEARFRDAVEGRVGETALREVSIAYRCFALRRPGLYQASQRAVRPGEDDELYRAFAAAAMPIFRVLADMGIAAADQVHFTRAIRSALHGFVSLERGGGFGMPESVDESFRRMVDLLTAAVRGAAAGQRH